MLAAYSWDGGGDGVNWSDPINWSLNGANPAFAPGQSGASVDVTINMSNTNVNLDIDIVTNPLSSFTLDAPGATFSASGRTLTVNGVSNIAQGAVEWYGSTWADNGAGVLTIQDSFTARAFSNISTNSIAQNGVLNVFAQGNTTTLLTVDHGFTNNGTINLNNVSGNGAWPAHLVVASGQLNNSAWGVINVINGQGIRTINADVINNGTFNADDDMRFTKPGGVFTNNGQFNVLATGSVSFPGNDAVFNQNAGTINVAGALATSGDTFNFNGGSLSGNVPVLFDTALSIGPNSSGAATFSMRGLNNTLSGDVATGQRIQIDAVSNTTTVLTAAQSFTNNGAIVLDHISPNGNFSSNLVVASGILTNGASGVITAELGQGIRTIDADVVNNGAINVYDDLQLSKPSGVFTNNADFNISATGSLSASGSGVIFNQNNGLLEVLGSFEMGNDVFNYVGGSLSGNGPVLTDSALNIAVDSDGAGEFLFRGLNNTLSGDVAEDQILRIEAVSNTTTVLTAATGFTNRGTIILDHISPNGNFPSVLTVTSGVLENSSTGVVTAELGQGVRIIRADVNNSGVFNINDDTQFSKLNGAFTNTGSFHVAATGSVSSPSPGLETVFNQSGGSLSLIGDFATDDDTFSFTGGTITGGGLAAMTRSNALARGTAYADLAFTHSTIDIGPSFGILNVEEHAGSGSGGNWTQSGLTELTMEIGGANPGTQHDQLNVENTANLTGSLKIEFTNGFAPSACETFEIITYGARLGSLPTVDVSGLTGTLAARVVFNANSATVLVYDSAAPINVHSTSGSVAEGGASTTYSVCLGTAAPPSGLVTVTPASATGDVAITPVSLTFDPTSDDWQQSKQFTVTAIDDNAVEGDHSDVISHVATSTDPLFDSGAGGFAIPDVNVQIHDNDTATLSFQSPTGAVNEANGRSDIDIVLQIPGGGTLAQPVSISVVDLATGSASESDASITDAILTFPTGATSGTVRTAQLNVVQDSRVEGDETLQLELQGLVGPSTVSLGSVATHEATIGDDDLATISFDSASSSVAESSGSHTTDVVLTIQSTPSGGELERDVSVDVIDLQNGSANTPGDYSFASQTVTFAAGSSTAVRNISMSIADDGVPEFDESLELGLANLVDGTDGQAALDAPNAHRVTIEDDDFGVLSIGDATVVEGGDLLFTVALIGSTPSAFDVDIDFVDGSAAGGATPLEFPMDYVNTSVTLSFAGNPGEQQQFTVATGNDDVVELEESFTAVLTSTSALVDASDTANGLIVDNDSAVFTIDDVTIDEAAGEATFNVAISHPIDIAVDLDVNYSDVTATGGGVDYDSTPDSVSFVANTATSQRVTVAITDDVFDEPTESFTARLSMRTDVGDRDIDLSDQGTGAILDDDADNESPIAIISGPVVIDEGDLLLLDATRSSDPEGDALEFRWDVDGDGDFDENVTGARVHLSRAQLVGLGLADGPHSNSVTVEVSDGTNLDVASTTLTVNNVAPEILAFATNGKSANGEVTVSGAFLDPALDLDSHTVKIDWGDGAFELIDIDQVADSFEGQHIYASAGAYRVSILATDSDGAASQPATTTALVQGVAVNDRVLFVIGSDDRDRVRINRSAHEIRVQAGDGRHSQFRFNANAIDSIHVVACGGDDNVRIGHRISLPTTIDAGSGNDVVVGGAGPDSIDGGEGDDEIVSRDGDDVIVDMHGRNGISTGRGNDLVTTGAGSDRINTGADDDVIDAGDGNNRIHTGLGDDSVVAGDGHDYIVVNSGRRFNRVDAGDGNNWIVGSSGIDLITSGDGVDYVFAGAGNDTVDSGAGADFVEGNAGHDIIRGGAGNDRVFGGSGNDQIFGGDGRDLLFGQTGRDEVHGGMGDDRIYGGAGNDQLYGDQGNDVIRGESGNDHLEGGAGNDQIYGQAGNDFADGGAGQDRLIGGSGRDAIFGGLGDDILSGDAGNDVLSGGEGDDIVSGGSGDDLLIGGVGADLLQGYNGKDLIIAGSTTNNDRASLQLGLAFWSSGNLPVALSLLGPIIDDGDIDTVFGGTGLDELLGGIGDILSQ